MSFGDVLLLGGTVTIVAGAAAGLAWGAARAWKPHTPHRKILSVVGRVQKAVFAGTLLAVLGAYVR